MQILSGRALLISCTWWHRAGRAQMRVNNSGVDLYRFFPPTHTWVSPLVLGPASSIDDPCELQSWRFSQLLLPCGPNYLNWRMQILIEGRYYFVQHRQSCGYYSTFGYYSSKYSICTILDVYRSHTLHRLHRFYTVDHFIVVMHFQWSLFASVQTQWSFCACLCSFACFTAAMLMYSTYSMGENQFHRRYAAM